MTNIAQHSLSLLMLAHQNVAYFNHRPDYSINHLKQKCSDDLITTRILDPASMIVIVLSATLLSASK